MSHTTRISVLAIVLLAVSGLGAQTPAPAQSPAAPAVAPTNDGPNPYETVASFFKMPEGRTWGATSAVEIDKDGKSIWVAERCGANSCLDRATGQMSALPTILKFDATGKLVASFGAGMLVFPHGIHVDRDGNVWVTDGQDNAPQPLRGTGGGAFTPSAAGAAAPPATGAATAGGSGGGAPSAAPGGGGRQGPGGPPRMGPLPGATIGHNVYKFSPDGKLLMTLGKPGGAAEPEFFYQPNDVVTMPNGDIFVAEGHGGGNSRILKFSKDGKLIKVIGKKGTGPVEFDQPHALAVDSKGRLFVGDRSNNRIQILDQEGNFIEEWKQYSRPSGIYIDKQDVIYVADSESGSVSPTRPEWRRGIRIGRIADGKDGKLIAFIPDPETRNAPEFRGTSAAEGVAVDAAGNIYGAEVGPRGLKKYVKK